MLDSIPKYFQALQVVLNHQGVCMASVLTPAEQAAFEADGYVLIRGLFELEEIALIRSSIEQDPDLQNSLYNRRMRRANQP